MKRQMFVVATGLAAGFLMSACKIDATDEGAETVINDAPSSPSSDAGVSDAATPGCREDFDCCADPTVPCGLECRDAQCTCADGLSDINGSAADGCEYACLPTNGGVEQSDGIDNDCDGAVDDGLECPFGGTQPCGAGTGICQEGTQMCQPDGTWSACMDAIGPQSEVCNGLDDDCDGVADNDVVVMDEMCDADLVDEDCDGEVNEDCECVNDAERSCGLADPSRDGVGICRLGVQMCAAGTWGECLGAVAPSGEVCDGLDDDCDGVVPVEEKDFDADGSTPCGGDCDDADALVNPSMPDALCDGVDQDCSGETDEAFAIGGLCVGSGACEIAFGAWECADLFSIRCSVDFGGTAFAGSPELPNGLDDDCDGLEDEESSCVAGDLQPCDVDVALHGIGECRSGVQACGEDGFWGSCVGSVFPSPEACNGLDDDCDGEVPSSELDGDGDGVAPCAGDCSDGDPAVLPGAAESCNGLDDDCDGATDEDFFIGVPCDGEGACGFGAYECDGPDDYRCSANPDGSDYPDPAPVETCNRSDDDCNGAVDDVDAAFLLDDVANCGACGVACAVPNSATACAGGACTITGCDSGFSLVGGSCLRCEMWPPVAEICDAGFVDDDCDGLRNEGCGCISGTVVPCGVDPALHGVGECHVGLQACLGGVLGACSGAIAPSPESCNGLDDDCDGEVPSSELDEDGDGMATCEGDCDDANPVVFPGAAESCNDTDDDCDGATDEDFFIGAPCDGEGACGFGAYECDGPDDFRCSANPGGSDYPDPAPTETCSNLVDDDCDGSVDDGCGDCEPDVERPCGLPSALNGVGVCRVGVQTCGAERTWESCVGAIGPSPESCNGLDDDCDGTADDGFDFSGDPAYCGGCYGDCKLLTNVMTADACVDGACVGLLCRPGFQDLDGIASNGCEYGCFPTNGGVEQCDGIDNDCDGAVDDDPSCSPAPSAVRTVTFAVTLPDGFALDATRALCSTFASGLWTCGDFTLELGADGRTLTASGDAVTGPHVFNLCTSACDDPVLGTWVVVREADGTLSQAAVPTVTFSSVLAPTSVVRNARGTGGNWFVEFAVP